MVSTGFLLLACLVLKPVEDPLLVVKKELLAADRAFCKLATEKGIEGWMSYMAKDAARLGPIGGKFISGTEDIRRQDSELFSDPKVKLIWEPVDVHAFSDRNTGITTGKYRMVEKQADGKEVVKSKGAYVTTWRKEWAGWKVIFDTGVPEKEEK